MLAQYGDEILTHREAWSQRLFGDDGTESEQVMFRLSDAIPLVGMMKYAIRNGIEDIGEDAIFLLLGPDSSEKRYNLLKLYNIALCGMATPLVAKALGWY